MLANKDLLHNFPKELNHSHSLYEWLMVSDTKTHSTAALSTLFTIVSAITARGYYTQTKVSTSLFSILIAKTGAGKNIVVKAPDKIMRLVSQHEKIVASKISSEGGIDDIFKVQYCVTHIIDEFGDQIGHMLSDKGGYLKVVSAKMKNLYSLTNATYHSSRYSSAGGKNKTSKPWSRERVCYGLTGITTQAQLLNNLDETMLHDGFLNRFIILNGNDTKPQFNKEPLYDVPDEIVAHIKSIKVSKSFVPSDDEESIDSSELDYFDENTYKTINLSKEASDYYHNYIGDADIEDTDIYKFCVDDETEINRAVSVRWRENTIRLATGLSAYEKLDTVSKDVLMWCYELVKSSSLAFISMFIKEASQSKYELLRDKAVTAFKKQEKDKWISLSYLGTSVRPFKGMKSKERVDILDDLVNIGLVETEVNNLNGKQTQCFRLVS